MKALKYLFMAVSLTAACFFTQITTSVDSAKAQTGDISVPIISGQFPVPPGNAFFKPIMVTLPNMKLTGSFQALGGKGNDIEVLVMDQNAYALWQRGNPVFTYYSSGKVSSGEINIDLPIGVYYIVFSNLFSTVSSKTVQASISLSAQQ